MIFVIKKRIKLMAVKLEPSVHDRPRIREWGGRLPVALVFLEEKSLALSTLGWQAVYRQLDKEEGFYLERFFWDRKEGNVISADFGTELSRFPLICFSLNFEGDFLNLIRTLRANSLPVYASQREKWPALMAGGPITFINPFPVLPCLDFIHVGESENGFTETAGKLKNLWLSGADKRKALEVISGFPGIYVPEVTEKTSRQIYSAPGRILERPACSAFVSRQTVFRDSFLVEVNRGCRYGCRFCVAGFVYRPRRMARLSDLKDLVIENRPGKVGLMGTALTDWSDLREFLEWLKERGIKFSLSSIRADGLNDDFLKFLRSSGIRSLTLAVEGISPGLRKAVNKRFDEHNFFEVIKSVSALRFNSLKLYFILGLPGEDEHDFQELEVFLKKLQQARLEGMRGRKKGIEVVRISASMFVPKPWTPLQWAAMDTQEGLERKSRAFRVLCADYKGLKFSAESAFQARIQGLLSRGDERVFDLLLLAEKAGGKWKKALTEWSGDISDYLDRTRPLDEKFPWDRLDIGVNKDYLRREWDRYWRKLSTTVCPDLDCPECGRCGMEELQEQNV